MKRLVGLTREQLELRERVLEGLVARALRQTVKTLTLRPLTAAGEPPAISTTAAVAGTEATTATLPPLELATVPTTWQTYVAAELYPFLVETYLTAGAATAQAAQETLGVLLPQLTQGAAEAYLASARNRLVGIGDDLWNQLRTQLAEGYSAGESTHQLAARIRETAKLTEPRALVIARTEVIPAANAASLEQLQLAFTDEECSKEWLCVTGDTRIRVPRGVAVARRLHVGQVRELTFRTTGRLADSTPPDSVLTVTSNHPMLALGGWVAASSLNVGDYLIGSVLGDNVLRSDPHVESVPSTVAELFSAAHQGSSCQRMMSRSVDLNGDRLHSQVDVVSLNGELRHNLETAFTDPERKLLFPLTDVAFTSLHALSLLKQLSFAHPGTSDSSSCAATHCDQSFVSLREPTNFTRFGLTTNRNTALLQQPDDRTAGFESEFSGDCSDGFTTQVALYELIGIRDVNWSGHVYDIQTEVGWFIANGMIVHNSTNDARTREAHRRADGQRVPLHQAFSVGGEALPYPGWPGGSPENVIQCRCSLAFVFADDVSDDNDDLEPLVAGVTQRERTWTLADERKHKRDSHGRFTKKSDAVSVGRKLKLSDVLAADTGDDAEELDPELAADVRDAFTGRFANLRTGDVVVKPGRKTGSIKIEGTVFDAAGTDVGLFTRIIRTLKSGDVEAEHVTLLLNEDVQGQGFAHAFNRHVFNWYRESGVNRVRLLADSDVGGYAWAREGYDWQPDDVDGLLDMQERVNLARQDGSGILNRVPAERRDEQRRLAQALYLDIADTVTEDTDPDTELPDVIELWPTPFELSQLGRWPGAGKDDWWIGKSIMLGSNWWGVRYLDDADA